MLLLKFVLLYSFHTTIANNMTQFTVQIQHNHKSLAVAHKSGFSRSILDCFRLCVQETRCDSINYIDYNCELLETSAEVNFQITTRVEGWRYICKLHSIYISIIFNNFNSSIKCYFQLLVLRISVQGSSKKSVTSL